MFFQVPAWLCVGVGVRAGGQAGKEEVVSLASRIREPGSVVDTS